MAHQLKWPINEPLLGKGVFGLVPFFFGTVPGQRMEQLIHDPINADVDLLEEVATRPLAKKAPLLLW